MEPVSNHSDNIRSLCFLPRQLSPTVLLSSKWKVDSLRLTVTVDFDLSWLPVLTQDKEALLYIVNYKKTVILRRDKSQLLTSWDELTGNKLKWPRRTKNVFVCFFTNKNIFFVWFLGPSLHHRHSSTYEFSKYFS